MHTHMHTRAPQMLAVVKQGSVAVVDLHFANDREAGLIQGVVARYKAALPPGQLRHQLVVRFRWGPDHWPGCPG